jgi:membrane peptidoglycan carboxypeptidase
MASGYATIANGGRMTDPYIIEKVVDAGGETLYDHRVSDRQVIDPELGEDIAADVSYAMQQVVQVGTGTAALALGRPAAGKTGTATNGLDQVSSAWFTGFTPQLVTSVMYVRGKGNEQLDGWLPSYFGGAYPAQTWTEIMQRDMEGLDVEAFPPPAYVDGEAPSEGHAPTPPPATHTPKPTQAPSPTETPSETPEPTTEAPTTSAPPTTAPPPPPSPTDCSVVACPSTPPPTSPPPTSPPPATSPPPSSGQAHPRPRPGLAADERRSWRLALHW